MSTVMSAIVVLALAASFAAALVFAAKWQEAKQKILDERSVWLSEIKQVERDKQILLEGEQKDLDTILWYADELYKTRQQTEAVQDRLSAILCPRNDHVWENGVCKRCGRMK